MADTGVEVDAAGAARKVDPETLVLRARPAPPIRFRRGLIVGLTAIAIALLVVIAWFAFRPGSLRFAAGQRDSAEPARAPAEALNALPASYGDAPKLGPPLPGDLGRPILERQRSLDGAAAIGPATGAGETGQRAREQEMAARKAAREAGVLVQTSVRPAAAAIPAADTVGAGPVATAKLALDPENDPNAQQRKADFVAGQDRGGDVNSYPVRQAASPWLLSAGSVIAASLITGLRSDLPGLVTAQVTEHVFDSATGRVLLVPQGARLIGTYDSVVAFGQKRALVIWQRILFPDGSSVRIDNVAATDPSGYAGLADQVDFHTWALLKGVGLSTLLGVGSNLGLGGESDLVRALRESTQANISRAGDQLTSRNLQIQPTITIRPGARVLLVVHKDLVLRPWQEAGQ